MANATDISGNLAVDVQGLDSLRYQAKQDPQKALRAAAQQFEALFVQMMLKSMRDATPQDGMFDSNETKLYTSMLDQQFAQSMAKRGIGLADIMVRQLGRNMAPAADPGSSADAPAAPAGDAAQPAAQPAASGAGVGPSSSARDFVNKLWPHAVAASRATGVPPHFIVGHAALESGWGKGEIRNADGSPSYNLFGIKAGRNWNGPTADVLTTEYVDGVARKSVEKFRSYGSYAEGLRDYANLLAGSPRYAPALENATDAASFARGLQQSGYATDPMYAAKLTRIINGSLLRQSLMG